jgi:hypothetical protein
VQEPVRKPLIVKLALTIVGAVLTLLGIVGVILPVMPGVVFLVPGLAILAGEYAWVRNLVDRVRPHRLDGARAPHRDDLAA